MSTLLLSSLLLSVAMATALVAWWRARGLGGAFLRWSGVLVVVAFAVETAGVVIRTAGHPNTWLYNSFTVVEFLLMLRLVACLLPQRRSALAVTAALGLLAMGAAYLRSGSTVFLLGEGIILLAAITCGWSLATLWSVAQRVDRSIVGSPSFWFFLGTLAYFGGIVPFVGMMRLLYRNDPELTRVMYWIIIVLAIVRYLLAAFAFHVARRQGGWDEHRPRA
ncbi:MAG TPA: hypothetical protein PKE21_15540 [Flavobacteriales bacterium]|nr:hypothetical protein [Flavobacteriales bacterium]HMR28895.1 hypothetical protein [Flavobacteriales bacterium]